LRIRLLKLILTFTIFLVNFSGYAIGQFHESYPDSLYSSAKDCYSKGEFACVKVNCTKIINSITSNSSEVKAKAYNLLGVTERKEGNLLSATKYYEKALSTTKDSVFISGLLLNISIIHLLMGDYEKVNTYSMAILSSGESDPQLNRLVFSNLALVNKRMTNWKKLLSFAKQSIQIASSNNLPILGDDYIYCAYAFEKLNLPDSADSYYKKAINIFRSSLGSNHYKTAFGIQNYAEFLLETSRVIESEKLARQAYTILSTNFGKDHALLSSCYAVLGDILLVKENYRGTIDYYQKALVTRLNDFSPGSFLENPTEVDILDVELLEILWSKAIALERFAQSINSSEYLIAALETIQILTKSVERLQTSYTTSEAKLFIAGNKKKIFESGIRISYNLFKTTSNEKYKHLAFEFSERGKYSVLRDLQDVNFAKLQSKLPDSLIAYESSLNLRYVEKRVLLNLELQKTAPDSSIIDKLTQEVFLLSRTIEQLVNDMEKDFPEYFRLKYDSKTLYPREIQNRLNRDQAVIEYTTSDTALYTFVITTDTFEFTFQPINDLFFSQIDSLEGFLRSWHSRQYKEYRNPSYCLYKSLIEPFEKIIEGKELIIIPDQSLSTISFEVLTKTPYKENPFHMYEQEPYLLYDYSISYGFSSYLTFERYKKNSSSRNFLGFAPDYSNSPYPISDIPQARSSVRFISSILGGKVRLGSDAKKVDFLNHYKDYKILHLYVHGFEDTLNPELSSMVFYHEDSTSDEFFLKAYQISSLQLNSEMVVLASCYSGSGAVMSGEGVMSIARSFYNAGAKSIVTSLWSASIMPTVKILKQYYLYLLIGYNKSDAMRKAKIKYLESATPISANPRLWSSLVVVGDNQPLGWYFTFRYILFAVSLILVSILIVRRKKIILFFSRFF
jgi:CHAT domain-containing protein